MWENGVTKGREHALKYAAGVRARGERRYAIFERTVNDMPVAYRLAMEENHGFPILWLPSSPSKGKLQPSRLNSIAVDNNSLSSKVMHSLCMTFFFPEQGKIVPTLWINKGKRRENWRK